MELYGRPSKYDERTDDTPQLTNWRERQLVVGFSATARAVAQGRVGAGDKRTGA